MLEVRGLRAGYGEVEVLFDVCPNAAPCLLRDAVPGPEVPAVQFAFRVAGIHTDADFRPRAF